MAVKIDMEMPKSCYECRFCRWISRSEPSKCEAITELTYFIKKEDTKKAKGGLGLWQKLVN